MLPDFPIPRKRKDENHTWDELVLGVNGITVQAYTEIRECFWNKIIPIFADVRDVNIVAPKDEAWYHFRPTYHSNNAPDTQKYAEARIEIFRSKVGFISQDTKEQIRKIAERFSVIVCAGWWPVDLEQYNPSSVNRHLNLTHHRRPKMTPLKLFFLIKQLHLVPLASCFSFSSFHFRFL